MSKRILITLSVTVAVLGLMGSSALAEIIVHHPVASNQSSFYSGAGGQDATNLWEEANNDNVDKVDRPDLADPSTWFIKDFNNQGWLSANCSGNVTTQWVVLDLGAEYNLNKIDLWNYNHHAGGTLNQRGINGFTVWKADDLAGTVTAATPLYTGALAIGTAAPEYYNGQFDLTGATGVRYVKIVVGSNHGDANYVGLGFVTFETVVPEPGTLALLAAGLVGLLAYAWRKRK